MKKVILNTFILLTVLVLGLTYFSEVTSDKTNANEVVVYQSKSCGCCKKWVKHLEDSGFKVKSEFVSDVTEVKLKMNLPMRLASCHTAVANGYIIEGHVPASAIRKLFSEKPSIKGISVPGMPIGTPGMEGSHRESYEVIAFKENGTEKIFMRF